MIICTNNSKNLCNDYNCEITKTEKGICIEFSSDEKEKVEQLHKISDTCISECCSSDDKSKSCC